MDDGGSPALGLFLFVVILVVNAILYGFMEAFDDVSDSYIDALCEKGSKQGLWLRSALEKPYKVTYALQICITCINILIGIYHVRLFGSFILNNFFFGDVPVWIRLVCYGGVALVSLLFLFAFSVIAPQKIAARRADSVVIKFAGVIRGVVFVIHPFCFLCDHLSNILVRIFGLDPKENLSDVTEEEIISMVKEGSEQGVLHANEAMMIHNIFEFADKDAKEIMTHRKNIVAVKSSMLFLDAMNFMLEKNNTRFPVYEEDIDDIIGVVHIKDIMIRSQESGISELSLNQVNGLIREITFIPETRSINNLFKTMQAEKAQMVIVLDEYGQTKGLVAMEDILEEIVGNILDEYDEDEVMIIKEMDGSYLMNGMAPISEVCEYLDISVDDEDFETLNGYLISLIDKIPSDHELFEIKAEGWLFQVLQVENKFIQTVKVRKLDDELPPQGQVDSEEEHFVTE